MSLPNSEKPLAFSKNAGHSDYAIKNSNTSKSKPSNIGRISTALIVNEASSNVIEPIRYGRAADSSGTTRGRATRGASISAGQEQERPGSLFATSLDRMERSPSRRSCPAVNDPDAELPYLSPMERLTISCACSTMAARCSGLLRLSAYGL